MSSPPLSRRSRKQWSLPPSWCVCTSCWGSCIAKRGKWRRPRWNSIRTRPVWARIRLPIRIRGDMSFRRTATAAVLSVLGWWFLAAGAKPGTPGTQPDIVPGNFVDVTASSGVQFHHYASQTAKKYMLEIMGSGVALLDYDNDGRLDIFLVNGAPISDPTPVGAIPRKTDPKYWNRLYHQKPDGTFEDVTERAGVQGSGYGYGVAVGDYD